MKIKYAIIILIFASCQNEQNQEPSTEATEVEEVTEPIESVESGDFLDYIASYHNETGDSIPEEIQNSYITEAMDLLENSMYGSSDLAIFEVTYGEVQCETDEMIAVSFNLEGDDGWNFHDADFMISYNKKEASLVGTIQIGSSTDFESYSGSGYNRIYHLSHKFLSFDEQEGAFEFELTQHHEYYNFNEEMYSAKEIEEMKNEVAVVTHFQVLSTGEIVADE
jgi:hypothetical protein